MSTRRLPLPRAALLCATALFLLGGGCGSPSSEHRLGGLDTRPEVGACTGFLVFPERLSEHPCFEGVPPAPTLALVPYDVRVPLYSDGADKMRYVALPAEAAFVVGGDHDWSLPPGGVLVKEFVRDGIPLETRLIRRDAAGEHHFATYVWTEDGSEARRVSEGTVIEADDDVPWPVPSEAQCRQCHTETAGTSLGLETAQLDLARRYARTGRYADQITTLMEIGFVERFEVDAAPPALPKLSDRDAHVAERARAYLHTNCAHCHRPRGIGAGILDFRFRTSLAAMGICDAVPNFGDPVGDEGRLLSPGAPERSILLHRLASDDPSIRMPPVGVSVVDREGVELVGAWIAGLDGCGGS